MYLICNQCSYFQNQCQIVSQSKVSDAVFGLSIVGPEKQQIIYGWLATGYRV